MRLTGPITAQDALRIYLEDHHAGAQAGLALARRAAGNQRATAAGPVLERLVEDIAEDAQVLRQVMAAVGAQPSAVKAVGAQVVERLARFKANGQLLGSSPLSPVVELEGLLSGVKSKRHVWMALRATSVAEHGGVDLDAMIARADEQVERLTQLWHGAVRDAFPTAAPDAT